VADEPPFISGTNAYRADDDSVELALWDGESWHKYRMPDTLAAVTADQLAIVARDIDHAE
jgi:hypothetical protein